MSIDRMTQWVVRPCTPPDLDAMLELATALGSGMTTFPSDRAAIAEKIEASVASFAQTCPPESQQFLLVLEDLASGAILGTAGVYPKIGHPCGFYSYRRLREVRFSRELGVARAPEFLALSNDYTGATEVGTLAVAPGLRGSGAGRLLARSRYLLMAARPDLFASRVIAEMRGWQTTDNVSPFWEAVGRRFFDLEFPTADLLSATMGNAFIADLIPRHPICIDLLPPGVRDVIGRPHRGSAPAMAMLLAEGFRFDDMVDVFDAGPQVVANLSEIATVRSSRPGIRKAASQAASHAACLVAHPMLDRFRVVVSQAVAKIDAILVPDSSAAALDVVEGDALLWAPLDPPAPDAHRAATGGVATTEAINLCATAT